MVQPVFPLTGAWALVLHWVSEGPYCHENQAQFSLASISGVKSLFLSTLP